MTHKKTINLQFYFLDVTIYNTGFRKMRIIFKFANSANKYNNL